MLHALLIGINEYETRRSGENLRPLRTAVPDILAIYQFLHARLGLKRENCAILSSPIIGEAALPDAAEALEALSLFSRKPMGTDDIFILYFAGHGLSVGSEYRLLTRDARIKYSATANTASRYGLNKSSLSLKVLKECSQDIRAGQQIMILDACRNDPFTSTRSHAASPFDSAMKREFELLAQAQSGNGHHCQQRIIVSSCSPGQFAYEPAQLENGWFCRNLLACANELPPGPVDFHELILRVSGRMQEQAWQFDVGDQVPLIETSLTRPIILQLDAHTAQDQGETKKTEPFPPPRPIPPHPIENERICKVIATGETLLADSVSDVQGLPAGHRLLEQPPDELAKHYYRTKDGHVAVHCSDPKDPQASFLIDKYQITAMQYQRFLHDLIAAGQLKNKNADGMSMCVDQMENILMFDAKEVWEKLSRTPPWKYAAQPWGLTRQNGHWHAVEGSERLPAVFVTWWGARYYSLWATGRLQLLGDQLTSGLPTKRQWLTAALYDPRTRQPRSYPWGEMWERRRVNYAGYWAGREIKDLIDRKREWESHPDVYRRSRPLPVGALPEGRSPCGCLQMFGNVWEWCADLIDGQRNRHLILGGDCTSQQESLTGNQTTSWSSDHGTEYIGFRCCWAVDAASAPILFQPARQATRLSPSLQREVTGESKN